MKKIIFIYLILALTLSACAQATASPSPDARLATAAVETFQAQLTQTAPGTTSTPEPSHTPVAFLETKEIVTPTTEATQTPLPPPDKAEWVAQSPPDNAEVGIGQKFDAAWIVRNIGPTTWNRSYSLRYFAGAALGERSVYYFKVSVPPDQQVKLVVDMVAPNYPGTFNSIWVLTNDKGQNFYTVYLTINVIKGPTKTPTKKPTRTPTPTP